MGPMNYIRAAIREIADGRVESQKVIHIPVQLIWGTRDGALNTEMAELSRRYVQDLKVKYVHGASHWVQQDEPDIVNSTMWEFLKQNEVVVPGEL